MWENRRQAIDAASEEEGARTAAHPFTTIEPNYGRAFTAVPCPCAALKLKLAAHPVVADCDHDRGQCGARYGHTAAGERRLPVLLKDVAGLVPGAWQVGCVVQARVGVRVRVRVTD